MSHSNYSNIDVKLNREGLSNSNQERLAPLNWVWMLEIECGWMPTRLKLGALVTLLTVDIDKLRSLASRRNWGQLSLVVFSNSWINFQLSPFREAPNQVPQLP